MATQVTHNRAKLQSLISRGARYLVVTLGEVPCLPRGTAISWHKTYDAAAARAGESTWYTVQDINDALAHAYE